MTTAHDGDGDRDLEWTGERYMPELPGNIRLEHVHRYLLARELVKGQRVLDIACGEGYGADLLAGVAAQVIGVDIIPNVVQHARRRYRRPHLKFAAGSCTAIPLAAQSVDVVVSFETLEHHDRHDEMMREVRRVLTPAGLLIISSPDRHEYSDVPGYKNPFHVRELYRNEFERLLTSHFRSVSLVGQRVHAGSIVAPLDAAADTTFLSFGGTDRADRSVEGLRAPLYLIGVATDGDRPRIPVGLLDGGEFIWSRDQPRNAAEQMDRSRALETTAGALRAELDRQMALVVSLAADKGKAEERTGWLQEEIERRGRRLSEIDASAERGRRTACRVPESPGLLADARGGPGGGDCAGTRRPGRYGTQPVLAADSAAQRTAPANDGRIAPHGSRAAAASNPRRRLTGRTTGTSHPG